jgi:hypothetical protein
MMITFANDNDVIVYALKKIFTYARDSQYIILAQSVWWIALIIGSQQELVIHIDNLKKRSEATFWGATHQAKDMFNQCDKSQQAEGKSAMPHNIKGHSRLHNELGHIHPDRISQAQCTIQNISDLLLGD